MSKVRDEKGKFKYNGGSKKRIRTEYNRKYHKEVRTVGERKERYIQGVRKSYRKNRVKVMARTNNWVKKNKEKSLVIKKKYRDAHKQESKEYARKWRAKNPDRSRLNVHRRRIRLLNAIGTHTLKQWELLIELTGYICVCCKRPDSEIRLTIDHIIPLIKGGTDNIDNIQPLCGKCNSSKGTKIINYLNANNTTRKTS